MLRAIKWTVTLAVIGILVAEISSTAAHAGFILAPDDPGTAYNISGGLTTSTVEGDDMDGMKITAYFALGGSETLTWADTGATSGGVSGTGWSLDLSGNTFSALWELVSSVTGGISKLEINGIPGKTVFDNISGTSTTPGSDLGFPMGSVTGDTGYTVTGTYRNEVSLNSAFYGARDLYGLLDIAFSSGYTGTLNWRADTDTADIDSVITPAVPEPASLTLVGLGAFGLVAGAIRRRRQTKAAV